MHRVYSLISLVLFGSCVSAPSQRPPDEAGLAGSCYALTLGDWSRRVGDERSHYTPPETFQLLDSGRVTPTIPYSYRPERGVARWRQVAPDSLVIVWTNGFAQAVMGLRQRGEDFVGTLEAISDAKTIPPSPPRLAPASVRRVACSGANPPAT
jgi:hypothetical protein